MDGERTVKLKGLDPQRKYWVWSEDGSIAPGVRNGADMMGEGLTLVLPQVYTSDLIYIQDTSLGKPKGLQAPGEFRLGAAKVVSDPFAVSAELAWGPSAHARGYRVIVSETPDFRKVVAQKTAIAPRATLSQLPPARTLYWKVEALSWGGKRWNRAGPGTVVTPQLSELRGMAFVSDMQWVKASAGAGNSVHRDANYYGKTISIGRKLYPKGVWTHSFNDDTPADLVIDISARHFAVFAADAGVEDSAGGGSVQFEVLVDGVPEAKSPIMRPGAVHRLRVHVRGARRITLRVLNGGDGYTCDHAAWGYARFIEAGAQDALAGE